MHQINPTTGRREILYILGLPHIKKLRVWKLRRYYLFDLLKTNSEKLSTSIHFIDPGLLQRLVKHFFYPWSVGHTNHCMKIVWPLNDPDL